MISILILLVVIATIAVFSLQNATPVPLAFLFWKFALPLSAIIFLSVFVGALMTAIFMLSGYMRRFKKDNESKPSKVRGNEES